MLYLDFTITEDHFGMTEEVELIPEKGGELVTLVYCINWV